MRDNSICHPDGTKLYRAATRITTPLDDSVVKDIRCTNQVLEIDLITPLDDGSSNDESTVGSKKAMLVDRTYTFVVTRCRLDRPQDLSIVRWQISYTSPATSLNKVITRQCETEKDVKHPGSLSLNIERLFGDQGYDMCGCEISVSAFLDDPVLGAVSKQQVHNRFRWFDAMKFAKQIAQRQIAPWRIDQGYSSLCGMAALYYVMAFRRPEAYRRLSIELHRTGIYKSSESYVIRPFRTMYEVKPTDQKFVTMQMWDADWIVLAGTRSGESDWQYDGIESGSLDEAKAINWPGMLTRLLKEVAGFASSRDRTSSVLPANFFGRGTVQTLSEIDRKFTNEGCDFLMEIEPQLLHGKTVGITSERHWVVYAGDLMYFTALGRQARIQPNQLDSVYAVAIKVFTWGIDPATSDHYKVNGNASMPTKKKLEITSTAGISLESFKGGFHGFIEVR